MKTKRFRKPKTGASKKTPLRHVLLATGAALLSTAPAAIAQAQTASADAPATSSFDIEAQDLSTALTLFTEQSGVQVAYPSSLAENVRSGPVQGDVSVPTALDRLLAGTGLTYRFTAEGAVTLESANQSADGAMQLGPVRVQSEATASAGYQGTPDWVYETPQSLSVISRQAITDAPVRNPRDLLDNVSGVWVNRSDIQNPGVTINIRGLDDVGRVGVSIDGARQNFMVLGHNSYARSYVDTAFVRAAEVNKTGATGVGGGTLGGGVDFRTLIAEDLIATDERWGFEANASTGDNAFHFDGSMVGAWRQSDRFALTGGFSYKDVGAYDVGAHGDLGDLAPDTPTFSGATTYGAFLKFEIDPNPALGLDLSWLRYDGDANEGTLDPDSIAYGAYRQDIRNDTFSATLNWNPADNDLIDLQARAWVNDLDMGVRFDGSDYFVATDYQYELTTIGGSLENTSRFDTGLGGLALHFGAEAFRDEGENIASNELIASDPSYASGYGGNHGPATRDFASGFANATLTPRDWLTVSGGLRYDWYRMDGETTFYDKYNTYETVIEPTRVLVDVWHPPITWGDRLGCPLPSGVPFECDDVQRPGYWTEDWVWQDMEVEVPVPHTDAHEVSADHSGGAWSPNLSVAAQARDWLQLFVNYGESFRPPTITESLISGGHPGASAAVEWAPNPDLRPETARTLEVGANITREGLFRTDDSLRAKAVYFSRDIEDYIVLGRIAREEAVSGNTYTSFINVPGTTRMQGVEIEANYDARAWYFGGSLTWLDVDFSDVAPTSDFYSAEPGTLSGNTYFSPPRFKLALDGGVRLFEERVTAGSRITHVSGEQESNWIVTPGSIPDYTVFDLYGSFELNDDATLRASVTNLTDLAYTPALGLVTHPAPGRTFTVSARIRF